MEALDNITQTVRDDLAAMITVEFQLQQRVSRFVLIRSFLVLEYEEQRRLALWQTKLMMNDWAAADSIVIPISGQNINVVWQNIVGMVSGIMLEHGGTLDEQIADYDNRVKLEKEIAWLEKLARAEKQPKRKLELVQKMRTLQRKMEAYV